MCFDNGHHGIQAEDGKANSITGNICFNNSRSESGKFAGIALENTTETIVSGNVCGNKIQNKEPATQGYGIFESGTSDRNVISANVVSDQPTNAIVTVGRANVVSGNATAAIQAPPQKPSDSRRHAPH